MKDQARRHLSGILPGHSQFATNLKDSNAQLNDHKAKGVVQLYALTSCSFNSYFQNIKISKHYIINNFYQMHENY